MKRLIVLAALAGLTTISNASTFVVSDTVNFIEKTMGNDCNLTSWLIANDQPNLRTSSQQYKCGNGVWIEAVLADNPIITAISRVTVNDPQSKLSKATLQALDQKLLQSYKEKLQWTCDALKDAFQRPAYKCHGSDRAAGSYETQISFDSNNPTIHDIRFQTYKLQSK